MLYRRYLFLGRGCEIPETLSLRLTQGGVFSLGTDIMDHPEESKIWDDLRNNSSKVMPTFKKKGVEIIRVCYAFLASNTVTNEYYPTLACSTL